MGGWLKPGRPWPDAPGLIVLLQSTQEPAPQVLGGCAYRQPRGNRTLADEGHAERLEVEGLPVSVHGKTLVHRVRLAGVILDIADPIGEAVPATHPDGAPGLRSAVAVDDRSESIGVQPSVPSLDSRISLLERSK
jgi:hypothetical protein